MEYIITIGIISAGYLLSNENKGNTNKKRKLLPNKKPSGKNIYESKEFQKVEKEVRKLSANIQKNTWNPSEKNTITNVVPGPPQPYVPQISADRSQMVMPGDNELNNKVNNSSVPVEYDSSNINNSLNEVNRLHPRPTFDVPQTYNNNDSGGFQGISLTGEPIDNKNFVHNNMVPFFGSTVKQNVDEKASRSKFENFTGSQENYRRKTEVKSFSDVKNNVTNPYGMQSLDGFQRERYYVSNKRNNEAPVEKIRVGPCLDGGYNATPCGGFQQNKTRDFVLPKNVDQLRVRTNPKISYGGRIVPGSKMSKPGKVGVVMKNKPDSFYINNPDRYFTTVGAISGPKQRPNVLVRPTNRRKTNKYHVGPATNVAGSKSNKRKIKYKKTTKQVLDGFGWRNLEKMGEWLAEQFDYGKKETSMKKTLRQELACKNRTGNYQNQDHGPVYNKNLRQTRKTNVIGNPRQAGNVQKSQERGYIKDKNDVAKTTMKETTLAHDYLGNPDGRENLDGGYKIRKYKFDETNRQTTSVAYTGDPSCPDHNQRGAYHVTKHNPKKTTRQETTTEYTGTAGGSVKPQTYEAVNNLSVKSLRERTAQGRKPNKSGPKKGTDSDNIKMTTRRTGDLKNKILNDRGMVSTKTYNSLPQVNSCGTTKDKNTLPNGPIQQRLDPGMLDALKSNPYNRPF